MSPVPADTTAESSVAAPDRAAVERARAVSHLLDDAVEVPGTGFRVGIDPILGILPIAGDAVAAAASLYIVLEGVRIGVPTRTVATMLLLIGAEFLLGSVPVVGTLFDAVVKVNRYNARTLESHLDATA